MDNVINIDSYRPKKEGSPILIPHSMLICSCSQYADSRLRGWNIMIFQMDTGAAVTRLVCRNCGVIVESDDGMIGVE